MTTAVKPAKLSDQFEQWLAGEGEKNLGSIVHTTLRGSSSNLLTQ